MKSKLTLLLLFALCVMGARAQEKVNGIVISKADKTPVIGASVVVKGQKQGTQTDADGKFTITASNGQTLTISSVGYKTLNVNVGSASIQVELELANNNLNEVVVIGYQKQSLKKSTSSVQVVSGKSIENLPAPSFDQLLQGKVSGVNIQNFTGEPGVRNTFTVRGNSTIVTDLNAGGGVDEARTLSTPLYVIDGIPISVNDLEGISSTGNNFLAGISISDIENITVQKDAAATAVWGSRGANGVIIIQTKKGRSKTPELKANYYRGITERPKLLPTTIGAEERRQKMGLLNEYSTFAQMASIPQILTDSLNPSFNNATDWQDLFYQAGSIDNIDLSVSAASDNFNYRVGGNYYNETGIVRNTGFAKYSLRGNFGFKINPKLNVTLNVSASRFDRKRGLGRGRNEILPINAGQMPASFYGVSQDDKDFFYGQFDKLKDKNQTDIVSLSFQTNYQILKGLEYSFQASYSKTNDKRDRFQPSTLDANGVSFAESTNGVFESSYLANILSYGKSINNTHNFGLVATQTFQLDQRSGSIVGGYNVPDDNIQVVSGIPQQDLYGSSYIQKAGMLSFVGQFSYDYKGKYIVNFSMRGDASSRFGDDTKWGYFPAISGAYVVSDEAIFDKLPWINLFKLRASYGLTGTQPDNFYAPFNVWDLNQGTYNGTVMATPSFENPLTQPNLTWNKSNQLNVGFDFNVLDNKIQITTDLYRRYNTNPILAFPFPFFTGYTQATFNAPVKILNEGVDIQVRTKNLPASSKLKWETTLNVSYNKNRIAALPNGNRSFFRDSYGYNQSLIYSVGAPIYGWAQMQYAGVYNRLTDVPVNPYTGQRLSYFKKNYPVAAGYPKWIDTNNDWDVWSDEDRGEQYGDLVPTGDPNPKYTGGIYNEFSYKNFFVGVQCVYTLGRDIINTFDANQFAGVWNFGNTLQDFARFRLPDLSERNYWTPGKADPLKNPGYAANFPSLSPFGPNFYQFLPFSTMWNENGNYFKIRSVTMGYQIPEKILGRLGLKNARLYSIIDNIYSFQSANVPDAELVSPQGEYRGGNYPLPRKYTLGLEVTF